MTDLLTRTAVHPPVHADAPSSCLHGTVAEALALAVAPSTGRFRPAEGGTVERGTVLGHITGGKGRADAVLAPVGGEVARLLVRPGQLVSRGQGLVWLQRGTDAAVIPGDLG